MNKSEPAINRCDPQTKGCLLRRLAEDSGVIPEGSICPNCHQSIEELEMFASQVGKRLANHQASRQQAARMALESVGIRSQPDDLTQSDTDEVTRQGDSNN